MAPDAIDSPPGGDSARYNLFAAFRFALSYPTDAHLEYFRAMSERTPDNLEDLRALYLGLFEAGMPQPRCPLLESHYVTNRPAPDVVLENKLFYKHFGMQVRPDAAPDSLLAQLEFLAWLGHCIQSGNPDPDSLRKASADFIGRHVAHWIPQAAALLGEDAEPYRLVFRMLVNWLATIQETD